MGEAFILRDPDEAGVGVLVAGVPLLVVAILLLFFAFGPPAGLLGIVPFLLLSAIFLALAAIPLVKVLWIRSVFQPAEGEIPRAALRMGERAKVRFRRGLAQPMAVRRLVPRLYLREKVVYSCGTSTCTAQKEIRSIPLPEVEIPGGGLPVPMITAEWTVEIPREGPASFSPEMVPGAPTAWVEWRLEVRQEVDGFPDPVSTLPIPVAPEVIG